MTTAIHTAREISHYVLMDSEAYEKTKQCVEAYILLRDDGQSVNRNRMGLPVAWP